ncbi:hypothetical protein PYCH_02140 [Pyrococcus yayanosii CH1]|uniref:Uncharacterized protein n=1 Tax=Pyrococcus yayanosii (strain CH1 / JCM 16557) TaxID=529709 RepID=F8AG77_PYRYC|nr:hypothetical protein PYCH_02140 [Pyrococcus yayanosii CH1]
MGGERAHRPPRVVRGSNLGGAFYPIYLLPYTSLLIQPTPDGHMGAGG